MKKLLTYYMLLAFILSSCYSGNIKDRQEPLYQLHYLLKYSDDKEIQSFINKTDWRKESNHYDNGVGLSALSLLIFEDKEQFIDALMENGFDIDTPNLVGSTALHIAAAMGKEKVIKKLIEKYDADFLKDNFGETPLHYAANTQNNKALSLLLNEYKGHINEKNNEGETSLFIALKKNNIYNIKLLLKYRANPLISNNNSLSPYKYSKEMNYTTARTLFSKAKRRYRFKKK